MGPSGIITSPHNLDLGILSAVDLGLFVGAQSSTDLATRLEVELLQGRVDTL